MVFFDCPVDIASLYFVFIIEHFVRDLCRLAKEKKHFWSTRKCESSGPVLGCPLNFRLKQKDATKLHNSGKRSSKKRGVFRIFFLNSKKTDLQVKKRQNLNEKANKILKE
jgi:hypothetical protein